MFGASLRKTEMELAYAPAGCKITDFSILMDDEVVGVSVTRALKFKGVFNKEDAKLLLSKVIDFPYLCLCKETLWS